MGRLNNTIVFACNQGGHFSQMMALNKLFEKYDSVLVTDNERANKQMPPLSSIKDIIIIEGETKTRKDQDKNASGSRWSYLGAYFKMFLACNRIWKRIRPKVIVSTGSNIAIPLFIIGKIHGSKIIFIETRAKVYARSMTGILARPLANIIFVQWPEMLNLYPKAIYCGTLV